MCGGHSVYQNGDWYLFKPDGHGDGLRNVMIVIIIMERLLPCKEYQRLGTPAPTRQRGAAQHSTQAIFRVVLVVYCPRNTML
jgi:hypothetical protein